MVPAATEYGFGVAYTLSTAEQTGGDLFSLDFPTAADYPRYPTNADERHRLVLTGIVGLPLGLHCQHVHHARIRHALQHRRSVARQRPGSAPVPSRNEGRPEQFAFIIPDAWAYRTVKLQVERAFRFAGQHARGVDHLPGIQHLQLRQLRGLSGLHSHAAGRERELRPAQDRMIDPGSRLQFGASATRSDRGEPVSRAVVCERKPVPQGVPRPTRNI